MILFSVRYTLLISGILSLCLVTILISFGIAHAEIGASQWFENEHTKVRLISATRGIGNTGKIQLGLQFKLKDNWKIYWRAPGDAGFPPRLDWSKSTNLKHIEFFWPAPTRFQILGMQTIGYKNEVIFPIIVTVRNPQQPLLLKTELNYLTCDDICIPYKTNLALDLSTNNEGRTKHFEIINNFINKVPSEGLDNSLKIVRVETMGELRPVNRDVRKGSMRVVIESNVPLVNPDIFVEGPELAVFSLPQIKLENQGSKAVINIPVTEEEDSRINQVPLRFTITDGERSVTQSHSVNIGAPLSHPLPNIPISLPVILSLALIGGLILNLMPCVLPVLSLKIMGFISQIGAGRDSIRLSFIASSLGILVSFFVIATGLAGLKLTGSAIGWGIQFQQPWFIVSLTVITSLFAYNLLGLFEFNLPSWIGNLASRPIPGDEQRQNFYTNFAMGAFATILATPCSAPFLGTAIGFALAGSILEIYLVFTALGIGMAFPYVLVAVFPHLAKRFPKPGIWMIRVKQLLAAALAATAVWLLWVLAIQINIYSAIVVTILMISVGVILLIKRFFISDRHRYSALAILILIVGAIFTPYYLNIGNSLIFNANKTDHWLTFAPEEIEKLVSIGKTVFVDVTAEWCITCQINKTLVLNRGEIFESLSSGKNVVAMKGDWTRPNSTITDYLKSFGRFGIPFNVVYGPNEENGLVLPELLTAGIVRNGLTKASGRTIFSHK